MDSSFPPKDKNYKESEGILKFLHEVEGIKRLPRAGWVLKGVQKCESVADHSHRLAVMGFFAAPSLDRDKIIKMGVIHDLGEAFAGDITPHQKISKEEKHEKENLFFEWLRITLPNDVAQSMKDLWHEYEDRTTPEAQWLYDADKFESVIQAEEYGSRGHPNLDEFMGLVPNFKSPQIIDLAEVLLQKRLHRQIPRQHIPIIFITGSQNISTPQCKRLSKEFDGYYISLRDILQGKSLDVNDHEAEFAALYLKKGLDTSPSGFMIDILKEQVDEAIRRGKRCVILDDFPRNIKQLHGFEERCQRDNLTLLLTCSAEAPRDELRGLERQPEGHFKTINCDGSGEDVFVSLKGFIKAFIKPIGATIY